MALNIKDDRADRLVRELEEDFTVHGAWRIPWGDIERLAYHYRDRAWRLPVHGEWRHDDAVQALVLDEP
jgi:hypothetical protein